MTLSPLAPLSEIQQAPLTRADLIATKAIAATTVTSIESKDNATNHNNETNVNDDDDTAILLQAFEAAWTEALEECNTKNGHLRGKHEDHIIKLQHEAHMLKQSHDAVEADLKRQAAFLRNSRDELQALFAVRLDQAAIDKKNIQEKFQAAFDSVATTSTAAQLTIPWLHFVSQLDRLAAAAAATDNQAVGTFAEEKKDAETARLPHDWTADFGIGPPSARALYLARTYADVNDNDEKVPSHDIVIAAHHIDQVLLQRQVHMLQVEVDRRERMADLHDQVGAILLDTLRATDLVSTTSTSTKNTKESSVAVTFAQKSVKNEQPTTTSAAAQEMGGTITTSTATPNGAPRLDP